MKTAFQKFYALLTSVAVFCIITGCSTANYYSLKQTRNDVDFAMNRFNNEVTFGHISQSFQPQVNSAYQAYKTAFDAALQRANSNYDAPLPDNVKQLADQLLSTIAAIPVAP